MTKIDAMKLPIVLGVVGSDLLGCCENVRIPNDIKWSSFCVATIGRWIVFLLGIAGSIPVK